MRDCVLTVVEDTRAGGPSLMYGTHGELWVLTEYCMMCGAHGRLCIYTEVREL